LTRHFAGSRLDGAFDALQTFFDGAVGQTNNVIFGTGADFDFYSDDR